MDLMSARNFGDLLAGTALALLGAATAIYSWAIYDTENAASMGPGYFPVLLGGALALVGLAVAALALIRTAPAPRIDVRSLVIITLSILVFAALLTRTGLVIACALATLIATRADPRITWISGLATAAGVAGLAAVIFIGGLGMNIPLGFWK